ncbi:cytochrome P450 [Trichoderma chlorosporum]
MSIFGTLADLPIQNYLVVTVVLGVVIYTASRRSRPNLDHIQGIAFSDGDNSAERYVKDSRTLLHEGYLKFTKNGIPFKLRNPANPDHPQVILPWKYLSEVKSAPENRLSFPLFSNQAFLLDYSNAPQQTDIAVHIVRTDLNKNLGVLIDGMQEEIDLALAAQLPKCPDWVPFPPYMALAYTISRATARVLAGIELSRNDEWVQIGVNTTIMAQQAAQEIRKQYPPLIRWLAKWQHPGAKAVYANRLRAAKLMAPILEKRQSNDLTESGEPDGVQWSIAATNGRKKKVLDVVDEHLFLGIASVHSSSATSLSILYDLLDHPEVMQEIVEEIQEVYATCSNGRWNKQALTQLEKLDSFMAESQRMHSIGLVTVTRSAVKAYVFKDGLRLPKNTQFSFPNYEVNHDPDVYPSPEQFDPWRFLKMRKTIDSNKYHFAYASDHIINFGSGTHACPGRYYASYEIKLILVHILTRYDVRWPDGQSRPPGMPHDFANIPSPMVAVLFKEKNIN